MHYKVAFFVFFSGGIILFMINETKKMLNCKNKNREDEESQI